MQHLKQVVRRISVRVSAPAPIGEVVGVCILA